MSGELAGMQGKAVYANLAHIGHKRQQKRQLLIHGHYYANFHKTLVYSVGRKKVCPVYNKTGTPFYMIINVLLLEFLHNQCGVVTAEAERVRQRGAYFTLLSLVECEIERVIDFFVLVALFVVDCGRDDAVGHCLD